LFLILHSAPALVAEFATGKKPIGNNVAIPIATKAFFMGGNYRYLNKHVKAFE
jgi:hypothetical protein